MQCPMMTPETLRNTVQLACNTTNLINKNWKMKDGSFCLYENLFYYFTQYTWNSRERGDIRGLLEELFFSFFFFFLRIQQKWNVFVQIVQGQILVFILLLFFS